jgi:hypothetical protein
MYRPNTLYGIMVIQHFLRHNSYFVSFLDDDEFVKLRQVMDARMKATARSRLGSSKRQVEIICAEHENSLWEK